MALQKIQHKLPGVLRETITSLCRNMVEFENELTVEGLIGVTLDSTQIFLVPINHHMTHGTQTNLIKDVNERVSPVTVEETPKKEKLDKKEKKKHRIQESEDTHDTVTQSLINETETLPTEPKQSPRKAPEVREQETDISLDTSLEIPPEFKSDLKKGPDKDDSDDQDSEDDDDISRLVQPTDSTVLYANDQPHTPKQDKAENTKCRDVPEKSESAHKQKDNSNPLEVLQNECEQLESNLKISSVWSDSPVGVDVNDTSSKDAEEDDDDDDNDEGNDYEHKEDVADGKSVQTQGHDVEIPVSTHGFEVLKEMADVSVVVERMPLDAALPSCSKDLETDKSNGGLGTEQQTPKKKRRKSESDDSYKGSSDGSGSDEDSDEKSKKRKKRKLRKSSSPRGKNPEKEMVADSPQSTGSEVEFVSINKESSLKDSAKKKKVPTATLR